MEPSAPERREPLWSQLGFLVVCLFTLMIGLANPDLDTWLRVVLVVGSVLFGGWTVLTLIRGRARV